MNTNLKNNASLPFLGKTKYKKKHRLTYMYRNIFAIKY
jgi:hypothetical protein